MEMKDYIRQQSELFRKALEGRKDLCGDFAQVVARERPDQIYFVASGTSRNACLAAAPFVQNVLATPVTVLASSLHGGYLGRKPLVIYVSQGGNSTNTIKAIEEDSVELSLAITGNPDGHINEICTHRLEIPCGIETAGPKTKGYTMTILLLYIAAIEAGLASGSLAPDEAKAHLADLQSVGENLEGNIERTFDWVEANADELKRISCLYVVGKGVDGAVAAEGALKVLETYLVPSTSFEFEEFLHGPSCSISAQTAGFYLYPRQEGEDRERMARLVEYHRSLTPLVFGVGACDGSGKDLELVLSCNDYMSPFEYILPLQVMSAIIPSLISLDGEGSRRFKALDRILSVKFKEE